MAHKTELPQTKPLATDLGLSAPELTSATVALLVEKLQKSPPLIRCPLQRLLPKSFLRFSEGGLQPMPACLVQKPVPPLGAWQRKTASALKQRTP
mmetsp:Transcript_83076/g.149899  ORF Transcript_83076/g.149899 Transcript_83076/m.149899 type:complete len:95 (-) Transcript_83076:827-1111(-)